MERTLHELSESHYAILGTISKKFLHLDQTGAEIIRKYAEGLATDVDAVMEKVKKIKPRQIFNEIYNIEKAYKELLNSTNTDGQLLDLDSNTPFSAFVSDYDDYLNSIELNQKKDTLLKLLVSAISLSQFLAAIRNALATLSSYHQNADLPPDVQEGRLSILLESEMDFNHFLQKISAINIIYSELCALAGESYNNASPEINPFAKSDVKK